MNCMPAKPVNPLDMATWKYVYIKYAMALDHMIPWIKEQINNSDTKLVAVPFEDLIKEMGITCDEKFNQSNNFLCSGGFLSLKFSPPKLQIPSRIS